MGTNGFARRYNISSYSWMETGCRGGREDGKERSTGGGVERWQDRRKGEGEGNGEEGVT